MKRNVDKIKDLEKELGRYRKKVADQEKIIKKFQGDMGTVMAGNAQINMTIDAILAHTALKYGERALDEDTGEELGWRLKIQMFSVSETLERYEVRTRRDETTQEYIVGVMERNENRLD